MEKVVHRRLGHSEALGLLQPGLQEDWDTFEVLTPFSGGVIEQSQSESHIFHDLFLLRTVANLF